MVTTSGPAKPLTPGTPSPRDPARTFIAVLRPPIAVLLLCTIGSCAPVPTPPPGQGVPVSAIAREARIVATRSPVECVAYARQHSGIGIRGDAWTWWSKATAGYRRGHVPEKGAVMVFRRQRGSQGHLAVVTRVVGKRLVTVDHANWLNGGRIHRATPVIDVSERGDWSAVRVWYTPGRQWGSSVYTLYGFIYPPGYFAAR